MADAGRDESAEERADRKWGDLLQELRVAQTGVQILFGFLLAVVFQPRFTTLGATDRSIYVVTVVLGAVTTGALIGPVSFHRMLAGRRLKPQTVTWASRLTVTGLVLLLCTMASSLLLILRLALHSTLAPWLVAGVVCWYVGCWFVLPGWARRMKRQVTRALTDRLLGALGGHGQREGVPGRVGVHPLVARPVVVLGVDGRRAERDGLAFGRVHVAERHHDPQVCLLGVVGARPARRRVPVVAADREMDAGRADDLHEVGVAGRLDLTAEQLGVELGEFDGLGTVENEDAGLGNGHAGRVPAGRGN